MDNDDELTGIFDNLTPDDFAGAASSHSPGGNQGRAAFNRFIDTNIQTVRTSYLAADGLVNPVAILASASTQWSFAPEDDETMGEYLARLKSEARRLGATWFFISRKTLVGTTQNDTDVTDPEELQQAIRRGDVTEGVFYFATRHEGDEQEIRHGIMKANGNLLGDLVEGNPEQHNTFFSGILD